VASTSATEIGDTLVVSDAVLTGRYRLLATQYRGLSLAVVPINRDETPAGRSSEPLASGGAWNHMPVPVEAPKWVADRPFSGLLAMIPEGASIADSDDERLLIRATAPLADGKHVVVVDLPIDTDISALLDERTGVRMTAVGLSASNEEAQPLTGANQIEALTPAAPDTAGSLAGMFRRTLLSVDFADWRNGRTGIAVIGLDAPLAQIVQRMTASTGAEAFPLGSFLVALGVLLLIVQGVALFFGVSLGRQITYAVHELFEGTERVQQGDFTHRITLDSKDQLGALGDSFNRMSASIEHLLHVQREKQRLDDELRIAHEIQMSLLPERPPAIDGVSIADLCVPAREVGGDYYDFFRLGPRRFGVLVADVSGKGTSAALYMAELKGLVLAISQDEASPKRLLTRVNTLLADHLDNRSFITMTYGVIDLDAGTLTHARAGHTPLLVVSGGRAEVLVPNGMVLGLRLPGAADRFEALLEENTMPIHEGDVIVFYTDGVTEAMDVHGELFGDAALGRVVESHAHMDGPAIRERVLRDVKAFVGEAEPHDDMTMVVVKVEARAARVAGAA
jgi:serine phosphatase RsbU (regulator of sigma subunit)